MTLERTLLELEEAFWRAAGNGDFYRENLAENALMVFPAPFGAIEKDAAVEAVEASPRWLSFDLQDPRVVKLTDTSAALVYSVSARDASGRTYSALISSVYVHRDGAWKLALHQQTPIALE